MLQLPARAGSSATIQVPEGRVASIALSQDFINEQIHAHLKAGAVSELAVILNPDRGEILIHGVAQVPVEELRAINLEPNLGKFRFQIAVRLRVSKRGHLVFGFPLKETYFYPADSKHEDDDRVNVPVQMLSIALASARGYLAALSGDFGGFDRQAKRLEAIPIERKQLQGLAKEFASILAFTGEKEINLNDELIAERNILALKINLSQLVPYLKGTELGGVRLRQDKKDGGGENYFVADVNADLENEHRAPALSPALDWPGMKIAPALILRLNQALFESKAVLEAE